MTRPRRWRTTGEIPTATDLRLRCLAPRVHGLGEGPLYHLLRDLAGGAPLLPTVESYARLPAGLIRAYRGDQLPPALAVIKRSS